jgi:hypothetical protein
VTASRRAAGFGTKHCEGATETASATAASPTGLESGTRSLVTGASAEDARAAAIAQFAAQFAGDIRTLGVDAVCGEVVGVMRNSDVRVIVLKGPSFAVWLYTDGSRRRYGDVDLLVSQTQFEQANAVLNELGFRPRKAGEHPLRDPFAGHMWIRGRDNAVIDLHVRLFGVGASPTIAWSELSAETERQRVGGIRVEVLRPSARAMHVALHAAQHGGRALKPIEDLRRALALLDDDVWQEAAVLAERVQALPAFAAGICQLPQGRAVAGRLALPEAIPAGIALRAGVPPPLAVGLDAVARAEGTAAKLRLLGRLAVPSPSLMRARKPLARRGPIGLACAYLWRAPYLLIRSGPALLAWRRARRQGRPRRPSSY